MSSRAARKAVESMFDKFLEKRPEKKPEPKATGQGRKPLPDHLRKRPKRTGERFDEHKRVKKEFVKRKDIAGKKHWKYKRMKRRLDSKRTRVNTQYRAHRKWQASLRRKYLQNRSVSRLKAVRKARREGREIDLDSWYQLSYAEWLVMWATAEDIYHPTKGLITAVQACGNPIKDKWATYARRIDETKPFTKENMAIWHKGKQLRVKQ